MINCNRISYDKNCNTVILDETYDDNFVFIYVLQLNQTTGSTANYFIRTELNLEVIFDTRLDGFYTLVTLKISKEKGRGYYYKDGEFYHNNDKIDWKILIQLNPDTTNVEVTYEYYFLDCRLRKCYVDACYKIFDTVASINCNKSNLDKNLIYRRDLLWSAINVIRFMTEKDLFEEAERLLEKIMGCNGLCNNKQDPCYRIQNSCNCGN